MDFVSRVRRLRPPMVGARLDLLLITHLPDVRYLCGFTGSAAVLGVTPNSATLFTDGRYREQARSEAFGVKVVVGKGSALTGAGAWVGRFTANISGQGEAGSIRVGCQFDSVTVAVRDRVRAFLPTSAKLVDASLLVPGLRLIKDADELRCIRKAVKLGDDLLGVALDAIRAGVRESEVAAAMEYEARKRGAEGMSFPSIVAAGARSALPHGVASGARIPRRGFVVLDFGVILAGYCSDMTRTVHLGRATAELRNWYGAVREAQQAALEAVKPGASCGEVDEAARSVLRKAKLAEFFTHSTGHGVGLEIHEMPRIGTRQEAVLEPGMVITIEPGIYVPGRGGIRIEDMVAVTRKGCEILTRSPKELIELSR